MFNKKNKQLDSSLLMCYYTNNINNNTTTYGGHSMSDSATQCRFCKHSRWDHDPNDHYLPTLKECTKELTPHETCSGFESVNQTVVDIIKDQIRKKQVNT